MSDPKSDDYFNQHRNTKREQIEPAKGTWCKSVRKFVVAHEPSQKSIDHSKELGHKMSLNMMW